MDQISVFIKGSIIEPTKRKWLLETLIGTEIKQSQINLFDHGCVFFLDESVRIKQLMLVLKVVFLLKFSV